MKTYLEMLQHVFDNGIEREDRTKTGTIGVFGYQNRYDLQEGFPIVTTKKVFWRGIVEEFLWMVVRGSIDVSELEDRGVNFWSPWKGDDGTIGPGYGKQFRNCDSVDQVQSIIDGVQDNPESRRHVISLWNVSEIPEMELPPCHGVTIQFYVRDGEFLDCQMYQRSADIFIGVPFNISFYSLFTHVVAQLCDLKPGHFVHTMGDAHIYQNHVDQVKEQLSREPYDLPTLKLNPDIVDIDDFTWDDIELEGYEYHPYISAPVAV